MNTAQKLLIGTVAGAMSAGLSGCASSSTYSPSESYAELEEQPHAEVETRELVGSRLKQTFDPNDPNLPTLSPTSIISREEIDRTGEVSLGPILQKYLNLRKTRN
jgi:broad specificity polyphosphatase/5'/3'-nucleotidase SurE